MTSAVRAYALPSADACSPGISDAATLTSSKTLESQLKDSSVTIGHKLGTVLFAIASARDEGAVENWDDEGAHAVSPEAIDAALQLATRFPPSWPAPDVMPEPHGGIVFEWYRDRAHLVAITTNGRTLRWVAADGPGRTAGGSEPFAKAVPDLAYQAIQKVVAN